MPGRFTDRCAFITGGAIGMGRAFGRALAAEGAAIAIADIDVESAKLTAAELEIDGYVALAIACDVADEHQVAGAVATAVDCGAEHAVGARSRHARRHRCRAHVPVFR